MKESVLVMLRRALIPEKVAGVVIIQRLPDIRIERVGRRRRWLLNDGADGSGFAKLRGWR